MSFDEKSIYGRMLNCININDYYNQCLNIFNAIKHEEIKKIFDEIPDSWDCNENDRHAGLEYLWNRIKQCKIVLSKIKNLKR